MPFSAVFPPMATPFTPDGAVDVTGIHKNVRLLSSTGLGGIVALGSNGEAPLLDEAESDVVIGETRQALDRGVLIAGTGRESTPATIAAREGRLAGMSAADCRKRADFLCIAITLHRPVEQENGK